MSAFHDFLLARFEKGGFSTEDALASFIPLARQAAQAHANGKVAPLDGVQKLGVEGAAIWYPEAETRTPSRNPQKIQLIDRAPAAVEVLSVHKRVTDVDEGPQSIANLQIGSRDQEIVRPVYLPGYVCWEHLLENHDPLTDVFSLGMILASLACSLDFNQPDDLQTFVSNRRNLFKINKNLHPVVAKAIVRMTELGRRQRPQDLPTLIDNLENYRDQSVDFSFDLASEESAGDKKQVIFDKLRDRLFELSRNNRLLHFKATLQSVNLTHASTPLAFDVASIKPEQILTWSGKFAQMVSNGEPVSLNHYLNFTEQIYLPSVLDRIRADSARDLAEFGFEQLRLSICFLRWADIKAEVPELYDSPLVLLPVKLVKKKGVRDSYFLQPLSTEAELNPIVRHLFKQLYDIDLPLSIDLSETTLDQLYDELAKKVNASEPGVSLNQIVRPRIDLIHDLAKRRLDRYRKSARVSGKGVRSFLNIDYSYDPANFHPLGLSLFNKIIRPPQTHLRAIVQDKPAPKSFLVPHDDVETSEKQKQFYAHREESDDNPYNWDFDLCRLTLGNFRYRKMTLVRDYAELAADGVNNPAFDAIFSLNPRPLEEQLPQPMPLEERFHIVACDPTQTAAIEQARRGESYIIQGPPGTGKSQTITNLIADYVMRGKKVLFVCEKRAAIDVVYARLKQQELHALCCLIHDSQADKKEFIADLKATYEGLVEQQSKPQSWQRRRQNLLKSIREELQPLAEFNGAMLSVPANAGVPVRRLLERAIELADASARPDSLVGFDLPDYAAWVASAEAIESLSGCIGEITPDGVLSQTPVRIFSAELCRQDQPLPFIKARLAAARDSLNSLRDTILKAGIDPIHGATLGNLFSLIQYAQKVHPLSSDNLLGLMDDGSELCENFRKNRAEIDALKTALNAARDGAKNWAEKLPPDELAIALQQVVIIETSLFAFLKPAWWRMRKILNARYNFGAHAVKPRWSQVLMALDKEYKAAIALDAAFKQAQTDLRIADSFDVVANRLRDARAWVGQTTPAIVAFHDQMLKSPRAKEIIAALVALVEPASRFEKAGEGFLEDAASLSLDDLLKNLQSLERSLGSLPDYLFCLQILGQLPPKIALALRKLPLNARQIESAVVDRCLDGIFSNDRALNRFTGAVRDQHVAQLARLAKKWRQANASAVLEKARQGFLEHLQLSAKAANGLTPQQKEFKAAYNRGRRELEHEFGKVMRHKSIRDLVAGDSGLVISDLKPVWLMSPLSVCDTLPLRVDQFDVVIFDEASQITLEEAVPSIFRATQAIVVGDEMQLPPTNFFSAKSDGADDEGIQFSDNGNVLDYDLSSNSFLNHASKNLASRMLGWHYRSRSESLISFSNWAFYDAKLLTVPEVQASVSARPQILAQKPEDAQANSACLVDRPISFHLMSRGVYENRKNAEEAHYIAHLIQGILKDEKHPTLGVVAFSEAQQSEIESALERLAEEDKSFGDRLEEEYERQVDGQYAGLLIKNLENIQGDERDVIILSVCYAPDPSGKMRMNFGPINQSGGEKRLNVAFSRAKRHMAVVSSIRSAAITNDYNDGANCLKSYLQYAQACSNGDSAAAQRSLRELSVWRDLAPAAETADSVVVRKIADALTRRGYAVSLNVGMSHFRCHIAVRRHGEETYRLGVLVDTETHYQQNDLLEREMMRPELLCAFGWKIAHVLSKDWRNDPDAILDQLIQLVENDAEETKPDEPEEDAEDPWAEFDEPEGPEASGDAPAQNPAVPNAQPAAETPGDFKRCFEFVGGNSSKFWEITLAGNSVTVRFGRIGTQGQSQTKLFATPALAAHSAKRLIAEKTGKGYQEKQ